MQLRTIPIHGKNYVPVSEKVRCFRSEFDGYRLITEIIDLSDAACTMRASVYKIGYDMPLATGYAREERNASNINKTNYVENCETSAIGRALSNLGIGIDEEYCSADELINAAEAQEAGKKRIDKSKAGALRMKCDNTGTDLASLLSYYEIEKLEDMKVSAWIEAMNILEKREQK